MKRFLALSLGLSAVAAVLGLVIGVVTGHGAVSGLTWGLWIGGAVPLVLGGSAGASRGGESARQLPGRRVLPGQLDPLALIPIGLIPIGIGVVIAVLAG